MLARAIYYKNYYNFLYSYQIKGCQSLACIDKKENYKIDSLTFENNKSVTIPVNKIVSLLNEAINQKQEEYLKYRFLAASAMPYLRQTPTEDIVNALTEELNKQQVYQQLKINKKNDQDSNPTSKMDKDSTITIALESIIDFMSYANDSRAFEKAIPVLDILTSNKEHQNQAASLLGYMAAKGNDDALKNFISYIRKKDNWESSDIKALKIAIEKRSVDEKFLTENQDIVNQLKNYFKGNKTNDDYYLSHEVASMLILLGEEKLIMDLLDNKNNFEQQNLGLAKAVYLYSNDNNSKEKALNFIINLYKNDRQFMTFIGEPVRPSCILYEIGEPSVEALKKITTDKKDLKNDVQTLLDINNPDRSKEYPCGSKGGSLTWLGSLFW